MRIAFAWGSSIPCSSANRRNSGNVLTSLRNLSMYGLLANNLTRRASPIPTCIKWDGATHRESAQSTVTTCPGVSESRQTFHSILRILKLPTPEWVMTGTPLVVAPGHIQQESVLSILL